MGVQTPWWMVVILGMGIVFIGLGLLVLLCRLIRLAFHREEAPKAAAPLAPAQEEVSGEKRKKLMAVFAAAIAEAEGTDVPGFRIVSFKRR